MIGAFPVITLAEGTILVTPSGHVVTLFRGMPVLMNGIMYVAASRDKQPDQFAENANSGPLTVTLSPRAALEAAQALVDRLEEYEPDHHDHVRDFNGHVLPALERLKAALEDPELSDG